MSKVRSESGIPEAGLCDWWDVQDRAHPQCVAPFTGAAAMKGTLSCLLGLWVPVPVQGSLFQFGWGIVGWQSIGPQEVCVEWNR